jgi:hypothetical protein
VNFTPTLLSAALAGAFAGIAMPLLWSRFASDSTSLVIAFVLVVALPAHAFVIGFGRSSAGAGGMLDIALLKRVGAWLCVALVSVLGLHAAGV